MQQGQDKLAWIVRRLPPWLTSLTLALVFLVAWMRPELMGWDHVQDLERLLFAEVGIVFAAVFFLPVQATPKQERWFLISVLALGLVLARFVSALVGLLVATHLITRVGLTWQEDHHTGPPATRFQVSLGALCLAWLAVGLVRVDATSWSATPVPRSLWWDVPAPGGARLVPYAVPVFGLVYFCLTTAVEVAKPLSQWIVKLSDESTPA